MIIQKSLQFSITAIISMQISSCSPKPEDLFREGLDKGHKSKLQKRFKNKDASKIFTRNDILRKLFAEFEPLEIHGAAYNYQGIAIYLGIGKFQNPDDAYGLYSGLASMLPRKRWLLSYQEIPARMAYKNPFISGVCRQYVFWFYSPSNPMNYFGFYETEGKRLLNSFAVLSSSNQKRSFHWRFLPEANQYKDSIFYVKNRRVKKILIENSYGAFYQLGQNRSRIFIAAFPSAREAHQRMVRVRVNLKGEKIKTREMKKNYSPKGEGFFWQDEAGIFFIYRYRRLIFYLVDLEHEKYADQMLRQIFRKIDNVRNEAGFL